MFTTRFIQLDEMAEVLFSHLKGEISMVECDRRVCGLTTFERQKVVMAAEAKMRLHNAQVWEAGVAEANGGRR